MKKTGLLLCGVLLLGGCLGKKTRPGVVPEIKFVRLAPDSILGGSGEDTSFLTFQVTDGDGDLGVEQGNGLYDIYIKSSRGIDSLNDYFADIPAGANDPDVGISATTTVSLIGYELPPRDTSATDSARFEVYVVDRAGHESNHITTTTLYIKAH